MRSSFREDELHSQFTQRPNDDYGRSRLGTREPSPSATGHKIQRQAPRFSQPERHPELEFRMLLDQGRNGFSGTNGNYASFSGPAFNPTLSNLAENMDFAAALANFQSCNDCSSVTIPHHHHPSGRLPGASATLDGHFCCSWLVHGQPCFLCFETAEALDNHIKNDHAGKDGTYRCLWQDCSKHDSSTNTAGATNFGNKPKLMRHVHSHTGYKPFPCPYPGCDKGFVTKEQLRNHETTHTKSRKYRCDQCGKAFAVKSALTTHITAVHEEKKVHTCDICGKSFADSSNLSKHKQTHYRGPSMKRRRNTREMSSACSIQSSPSMSTASMETLDTVTPIMGVARLHEVSASAKNSGLMAPPSLPKLTLPSACSGWTVPCSSYPSVSTTSSPPPVTFDPDCYCCDQQCPLPEGPATPCDEADDCDMDGFCCDERCTPPNGLVTPCPEPEHCDLEGFCDLPNCLPQHSCGAPIALTETSISSCHSNEALLHHQIEQLRNFQVQLPRTDVSEGNRQEPQRSISDRELEEQFTNMHGS